MDECAVSNYTGRTFEGRCFVKATLPNGWAKIARLPNRVARVLVGENPTLNAAINTGERLMEALEALFAFAFSLKFWSGVAVGHFFGPPIWRGAKWAFNWIKGKIGG